MISLGAIVFFMVAVFCALAGTCVILGVVLWLWLASEENDVARAGRYIDVGLP